MNIVSLFQRQQFFNSGWEYTLANIFWQQNLSIKLSIEELLLVGGFVLFTILGLILERIRLVSLSKQGEIGWRYRNRMKQLYAIIAIILVLWVTVQGYIVQKAFDWVWIGASAVILLYSIFLIVFPRMRKVKA